MYRYILLGYVRKRIIHEQHWSTRWGEYHETVNSSTLAKMWFTLLHVQHELLSRTGSRLSSTQKLRCTLKFALLKSTECSDKSCKVTEEGWTRQTDENRPPPASLHRPAVKQLWYPRLFVQDSHQPRSGGCGQREEEIALNLRVIEKKLSPVSSSLYLL